MNRQEFEELRELPGKVIEDDIRFVAKRAASPILIAEANIKNDRNIDAKLTITFNPEIDAVSFNVSTSAGPICRLDMRGHNHPPVGRNHKHALQNERCPDRNLPDQVGDFSKVSHLDLRGLFDYFLSMAKIEHVGTLIPPDVAR